MSRPPCRSADIPVFQTTAFDLNGWFVCNLMNHSHIGRARLLSSRGGPKPVPFRTGEANKPSAGPRLLSSRGGPYHVRPVSYTRPDPEAPRVGCCCFADLQVCRASARFQGYETCERPVRFENLLHIAWRMEWAPGLGGVLSP
jgi:hypothetical protein